MDNVRYMVVDVYRRNATQVSVPCALIYLEVLLLVAPLSSVHTLLHALRM